MSILTEIIVSNQKNIKNIKKFFYIKIDQDKLNEKKQNENKKENKSENKEEIIKENNEIKERSNNPSNSFKKISVETQNNPPAENNNENKENNEKNEIKENKENNTENKKKEEESKKEDPVISCIKLNGEISDEEINNSPKIFLEEENEKKLFNGEKIEINAGGMVGGRGAKDGVAIFSLKKIDGVPLNNHSSEQVSNSFKPDFEINNENFNIPKYPYIFSIYYKKEQKTYFIRAYSGKGEDNRILFVKLSNTYNLEIKQKEIISAGNIIFQVSPVDENNLEIVNLSKKDSSTMPKQTFYPSSKKIVTIGRQKDCDFSFPKDKSFSRIQTTFEYDEEKKLWKIIDGSKTKSSTNGTWVFGIHSFPIEDGMTVEILNTKVKISVISNN